MPRSTGSTDRDVRKFLRSQGVKPNLSNVERIGRELKRTESENEAVERRAKERGQDGLRDGRGRDVVRERVGQVFGRVNRKP